MARRPAADRNTSNRVQLEVFPTGSTNALAPEFDARHDDPVERSELGDATVARWAGVETVSVGERLRHGGTAVRNGLGHVRDFHASSGHRIGAVPTIAGTAGLRAGSDTDIVRPVLVSPVFAGEFACTGGLFGEPVPRLSISGRNLDEQRFLMWDAELDTAGGRRRVTFHLFASPSMVFTVLELMSCRRLRHHRRRFVADGVAAVEIIAHRLERAARAG